MDVARTPRPIAVFGRERRKSIRERCCRRFGPFGVELADHLLCQADRCDASLCVSR